MSGYGYDEEGDGDNKMRDELVDFDEN